MTVVLPTPPLPATMTTREVEQNSATSIAPSYEPGGVAASRRSGLSRCRVLRLIHAAASTPRGAGRVRSAGSVVRRGVVRRGRRRADRERRAHRRRAGQRTDRSVQRRADPFDAARRRAGAFHRGRVPARRVGRGRRGRERVAARLHRTRPCRSRCGSGRRAAARAVRPRCSRARPTSRPCASGAHLGPVDPIRYDDPSFTRLGTVEGRHREGVDACSSSSGCSTVGRSRPRTAWSSRRRSRSSS